MDGKIRWIQWRARLLLCLLYLIKMPQSLVWCAFLTSYRVRRRGLAEFRAGLVRIFIHLGVEEETEEDGEGYHIQRRKVQLGNNFSIDHARVPAAGPEFAHLRFPAGDRLAYHLSAGHGIDWRNWLRQEYSVGTVSYRCWSSS